MEKYYNLTDFQNLILYTEQYYNNNVNNIVGIIDFLEEIEIETLKKAVNNLVEKNDILRAKLVFQNEKIMQVISAFQTFDIEVVEINNEEEYIQSITNEKFDIIEQPLFIFKIIKNNQKIKLLGKFHHIISDAWSLALVIDEIVEMYSKLVNNEDIASIKYPSYIEFIENEYKISEKYAKDKAYWEETYKEEPQILDIEENNTIAKRKSVILDNDLYMRVKEFCKSNKISEYCFFLTTFQLYISKAYNVEDITIGTPYLNRKNSNEKNTIGMFVNTLPSRITINENMKVLELLQLNNNIIKNNIRHQHYSYNNIYQFVKNKHSIQSGLYNILFSYQNAKDHSETSNVKYKTDWIFNGNTSNPLELHFHDRDGENILNILFDYQTNTFNENDIMVLYRRYIYLIEQIIDNTEYVKNLSISTKKETEQILLNYNNTSKDFLKYFNKKNIINLIDFKSKNIAITDGKENITYQNLDIRINKLVKHLEPYIREKENVGIFVKKNIDTVVAMLALLKMNCTIVPIDETYPTERIDYIIKNAEIKNILYTEENSILNIQKIDVTYKKYKMLEENNKKYTYDLNDNLYIVYTSGSTGQPKPVTISHKNIINLIAHEIESKEIIFENSNILQFATMCFDVSYQEIFTAFLTNSTLVLIDETEKKDSNKLTNFIINNGIDILFIPPRYLTYLLDNNPREKELTTTLKYIITAGEQLIINSNIKRIIDNGVILYNHYGPAETHVATTYRIDKNNSYLTKPPIGKPILNSKIYILDNYYNICPPEITGEIYISGYQVGNGYYNKSDLTNEKFIKDPFNNGYKMYKTGDLGRFDEMGNIQYLGRRDFQVKINGYRIEIEEVEKHISNLEYINNVAIICQKDENEKNRLIAFIETSQDIEYDTLKKDLLKNMPQYMLPTTIKKVNKMPLNSNGKADKKLLLKNIDNYKTITNNKKYVEPQNQKQKLILEAMKNILKIEKMGIEDDFFELGGDSLLAISLQVELAKNNITVNTQEIYDYSTTKTLADYIDCDVQTNGENLANKIILDKTKVEFNNLNNILLTGATGYLGIHVLNYLITNTNNNIYCIIRETKTQTAEKRLLEKYKYYFNSDLSKYIGKRLVVLKGDLLEPKFALNNEAYNSLIKKIDIIINTAASVKHYSKRDYNYKYNVQTTENVIKFSKNGHALLNHISTVGIAGNNLVDTSKCVKEDFEEEDLYVGQKYWENVYVDTKIKAELLIINAIKNKEILGNIIRVGNLMNRYTDNKFQQNAETNAFQNKIKAFIKLKQVPKEMLNFTFDLTPVDLCAEAIVKLSYYEYYNQIYHVLNSEEISVEEIINILIKNEIDMKLVDNINNLPKDDTDIRWLMNDFLLNNTRKIKIKSDMTQKILNIAGFNWEIEKTYYTNVIKDIIGGEKN